jgi:tRNA(His) 5'-end guanylyltransferase
VPNRPYRRAYDHRIRDLVCEEREPALFAQLGIPRSTTASWIRRGSRPVVTTELFAQDEQAVGPENPDQREIVEVCARSGHARRPC